MPTRILIVDDHQIMGDSLRLLFASTSDLECVGHACDTDTGWAAVQEHLPDIVIMDLDLPGSGGLDLTGRIRREFPRTRVLVLTGQLQPRNVHAALRAGAHGYLLKTRGGTELLTALRAVAAGQNYLCPEATAIVLGEQFPSPAERATHPPLTGRETEVLEAIASGASTKEIAFRLGVSTKTIETHRAALMRKIGVDSVAELTKFAIRLGVSRL
jgi:DNA-binding NarL/FixJ family response regulator